MILRHKVAYCTLNSVVQQLNAESDSIDVSTTAAQNIEIATQSANFQAYTKRLIYEVSSVMSEKMKLVFVPVTKTQSYYRPYLADGNNFYLTRLETRLVTHDPILSISSITWDGTALAASKYRLAHDGQYAPDTEIAIDSNENLQLPTTFSGSVDIAGTWGYHTNPDEMWIDSSDTVQDNPLSASATTLNVSDGNNFEILQYVQIEDETLLITDISTNALTVERGQLGTTAASHVQTTAISKYRPHPEIELEARRLAVRHWHLRGWPVGAFNLTPEEAIEIDPNAVQIVVPPLHKVWSV